MQHFALVGVLALATLDHEQVLLRGDVEILPAKSGYGQSDAVAVFAAALDIEGRIILAAIRTGLAFEQVEQPVEADGGAAIGSEIDTSHVANPPLSNLNPDPDRPASVDHSPAALPAPRCGY